VSERTYSSIGQVLDQLKEEFPDLTISKIRFLESQGLLDPERTPSGYRKFYEADMERLRFILRAQHEHYLPLKVIKGRLGVEGDGFDADPTLFDDGMPAGETPPAAAPAPAPAPVVAPSAPQESASAEGVPPESAPTDSGPADGRRGGTRASGRTGSRATGARPAEAPVPAPAPAAAPAAVDAPSPKLELVAADLVGGTADPVSMTIEELAELSGLTPANVTELERFGLLTGRRIAGTTYYDADCVEIACVAAAFRSFGVEARHLRMYKTAVEREAAFYEQVVTPMLKQRNPQARRQAVETLLELSRLGHAMRVATLRQVLRDYTGAP